MKLALVHDYLCGVGGSERVFQYMCEEFPEADVYTLAYNPEATLPYFKSRRLRTTWLNPLVQSMDAFRWSFPVATYIMEQLDLRQYDVVLTSSATVAKYVKAPNGKHICYCYIPTRALWQAEVYFGRSRKGRLLKMLLPHLQRRDYAAAQRVDQFIAISNVSREHIKKTYHRESEILFSPINTEQFGPSPSRGNHYLIVSRLEHWKRVDYAIEAFNQLGLPLRVIGTGKDEESLKAMANSNITFLGAVDDATLAREYSEALAVIFTPLLEYGLIPLEANASGTPVICYGSGGTTETMIPLGGNCELAQHPTAVFFRDQTADALIDAVHRFANAAFSSEHLVQHASLWSVPMFKKGIRAAVESV